MLRNFLVTAQLAASEEGLSSMELVMYTTAVDCITSHSSCQQFHNLVSLLFPYFIRLLICLLMAHLIATSVASEAYGKTRWGITWNHKQVQKRLPVVGPRFEPCMFETRINLWRSVHTKNRISENGGCLQSVYVSYDAWRCLMYSTYTGTYYFHPPHKKM
jgi:hypothetical protein